MSYKGPKFSPRHSFDLDRSLNEMSKILFYEKRRLKEIRYDIIITISMRER